MNEQQDDLNSRKPAIFIHKFYTVYERTDADGKLIADDWVTYQPRGDTRSLRHAAIRRVSAVLSAEDCGENIAYHDARMLWGDIKPNYEYWKETNKLPETGTPLGAWAGITPQQGDILRSHGFKTIEDVANASDIVIMKTGLPNVLEFRAMAKKFLSTGDKAAEAAKQAKLEADNAELRDQMAEMQKMMTEMMARQSDEDKPAKGKRKAA